MRSLNAEFQPFGLKTKAGDRGDRRMDRRMLACEPKKVFFNEF